jgi:hypothetical protein
VKKGIWGEGQSDSKEGKCDGIVESRGIRTVEVLRKILKIFLFFSVSEKLFRI